jgi:hypothetical protein
MTAFQNEDAPAKAFAFPNGTLQYAGDNGPRGGKREVAVQALMDLSFVAPANTATHISGALPTVFGKRCQRWIAR